MEYYRKAAEEGEQKAKRRLGECYIGGIGGVEKNPVLGLKLLEEGASLGNSFSQYLAAMMYRSEKDNGIERNLTKSWRWHKKGAAQKDHRHITALGLDVFKLFDQYENCRQSCYCVIACRQFRKEECDWFLKGLPLDLVRIVAVQLWSTRKDESWDWKIDKETVEPTHATTNNSDEEDDVFGLLENLSAAEKLDLKNIHN